MEQTDWEARYRAKDTPWEKGEPAPGLVDFLTAHPRLPRGSVLVPGCGSGHDAQAWERAGFHVTAMDLAPSAVAQAKARLGTGGAARVVQGNFLLDPPPAQFDWIFEHTLFCAILPSERGAYAQAVRRWLAPGGCFLAIHFLIDDREGPPFGTTRDEVLELFRNDFELVSEWEPRSWPNRLHEEWMFWWRWRDRARLD